MTEFMQISFLLPLPAIDTFSTDKVSKLFRTEEHLSSQSPNATKHSSCGAADGRLLTSVNHSKRTSRRKQSAVQPTLYLNRSSRSKDKEIGSEAEETNTIDNEIQQLNMTFSSQDWQSIFKSGTADSDWHDTVPANFSRHTIWPDQWHRWLQAAQAHASDKQQQKLKSRGALQLEQHQILYLSRKLRVIASKSAALASELKSLKVVEQAEAAKNAAKNLKIAAYGADKTAAGPLVGTEVFKGASKDNAKKMLRKYGGGQGNANHSWDHHLRLRGRAGTDNSLCQPANSGQPVVKRPNRRPNPMECPSKALHTQSDIGKARRNFRHHPTSNKSHNQNRRFSRIPRRLENHRVPGITSNRFLRKICK
uniref:Variant surface glycoprotein 1125.5165 n=1 Tax=Trypanosoma brucei TaxID=5691 RepID=A0A1J0RBJ0_9TRYP|nr:variant surface glycoprotein 1125.5165 [Trypanosoma brucei]